MRYEFELREFQPRPYVSSRATTTRADLADTIAGLLRIVWEHIESEAGMPAGPPFTCYHRDEGGVVEVEAGIPLDRQIEGAVGVTSGVFPGGSAVSVYYTGPYEGVREATAALAAWAAKNGREPLGPVIQNYWTDPSAEPDETKRKTEVVMLLHPR